MNALWQGGAGWLLVVHIVAGGLALLAASMAFIVKAVDAAHRWHVRTGRTFVAAMAMVVLSAIPLAIAARNRFLLLIGVFSGYLVLSGWRHARDRGPGRDPLIRYAAALMFGTGLTMIGLGVGMTLSANFLGLALIAFGAIGTTYAAQDWRGFAPDARTRIARHLSRMLAATIATLTAFLVTNIDTEPAILFWLLPTAIISPVIAYWSRRIHRGHRPKGMPPSTLQSAASTPHQSTSRT